jgi:hypothetical protein
MKLEHLEPILFAKQVLERRKGMARVLCEFPYNPSLPMLLEGAAQASSALGEAKKGFLIGASETILYKKVLMTTVEIEIRQEFSNANLRKFSFLIKDYAQGEFSIYVE